MILPTYMEDFDTTINIIVVGNGHVGKTSLTTRYCKNSFSGEYKKTIGANYLEKRDVTLDCGEVVNMMIYDTAGQEEYGAMTKSHFRGAGAAILVFSSTDKNSLLALQDWKDRVLEDCADIPIVVVQSKIDLCRIKETGDGQNPGAALDVIPQDEIDEAVAKLKFPLFKVSASTNVNVDIVFETVATMFVEGGHKFDDSFLSTIATASSPSSSVAKGSSENSSAVTNETKAALLKSRIKGIDSNGSVHNNRVDLRQPSRRRTGGKKNGGLCSIS